MKFAVSSIMPVSFSIRSSLLICAGAMSSTVWVSASRRSSIVIRGFLWSLSYCVAPRPPGTGVRRQYVDARQGAPLWGSLVSCGRLAIGQTAALAGDGGGKRGTLWVARRLPACPTERQRFHSHVAPLCNPLY